MVDGERKRVRTLRHSALRTFVLRSVGAVVPPVVFALCARSAAGEPGAVLTAILAFAGLSSLFVSPLLVLAGFSALRRVRAYGRDLEEGKLLRFMGTISSFDSLALDPDLALLTRRGVFVPEPGAEQDMVVLPHASELLHVNGRWIEAGRAVHVERVAAPPLEPFKMPLPDDIEAKGSEAVRIERRRLTSAECDELTRHASMLRRPGRLFWFLALIAAVAISAWQGQGFALPPDPVTIPLALLAFGFALFTWQRRLRVAERLDKDAELGWVITVDSTRGPNEADESELPAQGVETLLHTRMDWTVNRRPATWRRFAGRASE
jgi:hypothetical protein